MKAIWNGVTLAESDDTIVIENNHYFPPNSVNKRYLQASDHTSVCPWKGNAQYYTVVVDENENKNAGWYYPEPKEKAKEIKGYVAFWNGVEVVTQ